MTNPVEFAKVKSSNLAGVYYDPATRELHVQFPIKKGDEVIGHKVYAHADVSPEQHAEFMKAESVGSHYAKHFRGNEKHPHRVVDPAPEASK